MAAPLTASMPQFTQLGVNALIDVEALDPSTGLPVDGVTVTLVDIYADLTIPPTESGGVSGSGQGGTGGFTVGPYMLVGGPNA